MADEDGSPRKGIWFGLGLSGSLETVLQIFDEERKSYYRTVIAEHTDDYDKRFDQAESVAAAMFGDAQKLGSSDLKLIFDQLSSLREHDGLGDDTAVIAAVFDALKVKIGEHLVTMSVWADDRLFELLVLMKKCPAGHRTARFLACVSKCYLFGFDVECIAMCRAALEAQVRAEVPDDDCLTLLRPPGFKGKPMFDLSDRIAVARSQGRITQEIADKANLVRKDGNDVLHTAPKIPRPAIAVINDTLAVIEALG